MPRFSFIKVALKPAQPTSYSERPPARPKRFSIAPSSNRRDDLVYLDSLTVMDARLTAKDDDDGPDIGRR
jgi:hypothetical protein